MVKFPFWPGIPSWWVILILLIATFANLQFVIGPVNAVGSRGPTILYVGENATYTRIQDAIDAAQPGDTVFVYNGIYNENLLIGKKIELIGESSDNTVIHAKKELTDGIFIWANETKIFNFKLTCEEKIHYNFGIYLYNVTGCMIDNNNIMKNFTSGIFLFGSNNNSILNNRILNTQNGIKLNNSYANIISNNTIQPGFGNGIHLEESNNNDINDNDILHCNNGIYSERSIENKFENNSVKYSVQAVKLDLGSNYNIFINNDFSNNERGFDFTFSDNISIINNNISNVRYGFSFGESDYITLINNDFSNIDYGNYFWFSDRIILINNTIESLMSDGINFMYSRNNKLMNNSLKGGGLSVWGYSPEYYLTHHIDTSNTVNDRPIYYWKNRTDEIVSKDVGQILLLNCTNITISDLDLNSKKYVTTIWNSTRITITNNSFKGILLYLELSENCTINNNSFLETITGWYKLKFGGISLEGSDHNIIENNLVFGGGTGIYLRNSDDNNVKYNRIFNASYGMSVHKSNTNKITNNIISDNENGMTFTGSTNNTITRNTIAFNRLFGIHLKSTDERKDDERIYYHCENNSIYHNNMINNNQEKIDQQYQVFDEGTNIWDNGYPSGGNFWSDHFGVDEKSGINQDIPGNDNICDEAYETDPQQDQYGRDVKTDLGIKDNYPLMQQIDNGIVLPKTTPNSPMRFNGEGGDGKIKLTWLQPLYDGGASITEFYIYRTTSDGEVKVITLPGNVFEYVDKGFTNYKVYYYTIVAENELGSGPNSTKIYAVPFKPPKDPGKEPFISVNLRQSFFCICISLIVFSIVIFVLIVRQSYKRMRRLKKELETKIQKNKDKDKPRT